jgi:phage tail-like protein
VSLADQLPACLAEDRFLGQFLGILDEVAQTVEVQVSGLENLVDVSVAPEQMVQWLGAFWLDVYLLDPSMDVDRRRDWVREMGSLLWWRGTREGLTGLLRRATDRAVEVTDSGGIYRAGEAPHYPRHVHIWIEEGGLTSDEHVLAFVHRELPAEVTFELQIGDRIVWPPAKGRR